MVNTVNSRVMAIQKTLKISDIKFCTMAGFSTGTLHRIKKGETLSDSTITAICDQFGVDRAWLLNGKGNLEIKIKKEVSEVDESIIPQLKEEISFLKRQIESQREQMSVLREMFKMLHPEVNFLDGNVFSGFLISKTDVSVRA